MSSLRLHSHPEWILQEPHEAITSKHGGDVRVQCVLLQNNIRGQSCQAHL